MGRTPSAGSPRCRLVPAGGQAEEEAGDAEEGSEGCCRGRTAASVCPPIQPPACQNSARGWPPALLWFSMHEPAFACQGHAATAHLNEARPFPGRECGVDGRRHPVRRHRALLVLREVVRCWPWYPRCCVRACSDKCLPPAQERTEEGRSSRRGRRCTPHPAATPLASGGGLQGTVRGNCTLPVAKASPFVGWQECRPRWQSHATQLHYAQHSSTQLTRSHFEQHCSAQRRQSEPASWALAITSIGTLAQGHLAFGFSGDFRGALGLLATACDLPQASPASAASFLPFLDGQTEAAPKSSVLWQELGGEQGRARCQPLLRPAGSG